LIGRESPLNSKSNGICSLLSHPLHRHLLPQTPRVDSLLALSKRRSHSTWISTSKKKIDANLEALDFWRINHTKYPRLALLVNSSVLLR
ncbi:hypothetical protein PENTCL1PPCAC_12290, partial [Pristionchus entomophagus]